MIWGYPPWWELDLTGGMPPFDGNLQMLPETCQCSRCGTTSRHRFASSSAVSPVRCPWPIGASAPITCISAWGKARPRASPPPGEVQALGDGDHLGILSPFTGWICSEYIRLPEFRKTRKLLDTSPMNFMCMFPWCEDRQNIRGWETTVELGQPWLNNVKYFSTWIFCY